VWSVEEWFGESSTFVLDQETALTQPDASAPLTAETLSGTVRSPKTAELVARTLRRMVVDGQLNDGDFLPHETELMAHFNISRPMSAQPCDGAEAEAHWLRHTENSAAELLKASKKTRVRDVMECRRASGSPSPDVRGQIA
jgi:hypothetical protein